LKEGFLLSGKSEKFFTYVREPILFEKI